MTESGRTTPTNDGYARSDEKTVTIASGDTYGAPIDLGRNYSFIVLKCDDASNIQASTTLTLHVAYGDSDTLAPLYGDTAVYASATLPTSGGFAFWVKEAAFAQRLLIVLSKATSGGTAAFSVYGVDSGVR